METSGPSFSLQKVEQDFPVTLYTGVDCEKECAVARDFLKRRGVTFNEKVIKTTDDANAFKKQTGITEPGVPSLLVGAKAEKGYLENAWNKLLDAAGYPPSNREKTR